jgi:hypothetical protein
MGNKGGEAAMAVVETINVLRAVSGLALMAQTPRDHVGDRQHDQLVFFGEDNQLGQARHRAVVVEQSLATASISPVLRCW